MTKNVGAHAQLNIDAEPSEDQFRGRIDIIAGYVFYRPALTTILHLDLRGGVFFPPVSLENPGPAWTTVYTITQSALNSWIGEEVRPTGASYPSFMPESAMSSLEVLFQASFRLAF